MLFGNIYICSVGQAAGARAQSRALGTEEPDPHTEGISGGVDSYQPCGLDIPEQQESSGGALLCFSSLHKETCS